MANRKNVKFGNTDSKRILITKKLQFGDSFYIFPSGDSRWPDAAERKRFYEIENGTDIFRDNYRTK
jgi:hypothetical protein